MVMTMQFNNTGALWQQVPRRVTCSQSALHRRMYLAQRIATGGASIYEIAIYLDLPLANAMRYAAVKHNRETRGKYSVVTTGLPGIFAKRGVVHYKRIVHTIFKFNIITQPQMVYEAVKKAMPESLVLYQFYTSLIQAWVALPAMIPYQRLHWLAENIAGEEQGAIIDLVHLRLTQVIAYIYKQNRAHIRTIEWVRGNKMSIGGKVVAIMPPAHGGVSDD